MSDKSANEWVSVELDGRVAIVTLDRPKALNALNSQVLKELTNVMVPLDDDPAVGCFILTGYKKAFAAGADIAEMQDKTYPEAFQTNMLAGWEIIAGLRTPKIAAVSGYALGGGCELAMMCDTIYCSESAKFGQPEIKLGVIPGMGGSQRLTKLIGKSKAMDLILTGRMMDAVEAKEAGIVARIYADDELLNETKKAAAEIASYSKTTAMFAREAVDRALETSLTEGLVYERRVFHSLFGTADQQEGMGAFIEKREAKFKR